MRQLVSQGEHLRRLRVRAVHEDERGPGVGEREPPELLGIEATTAVAAHDPAHHHQDPRGLAPIAEPPQGLGPGRTVASRVEVEVQRLPKPRRRLDEVVFALQHPDDRTLRLTAEGRVLPIPVLPLPALVHRVQEVSARVAHRAVGDGTEIGNGHPFVRWFAEEQETDGDARHSGELLQLPQRRLPLPSLPVPEFRKAFFDGGPLQAGPVDGPPKQSRTDLDPRGPSRRRGVHGAYEAPNRLPPNSPEVQSAPSR